MKHKISPLARTSLLALMIGVGPVALTAQTQDQRNQTQREQRDQNQSGTQSDSSSSNTQHQGAHNQSDTSRHVGKSGKRLGDVIGQDVHNRQGEKLGTIDDIVIDTRSGDASHVIVNHGGVLGIGTSAKAIPMGALNYENTPGDNEKRLVVNITSGRWKQAPDFDRDRLNDLSGQQHTERYEQFYGPSTLGRGTDARTTSTSTPDHNTNYDTTPDTTHRTTPGMNPSDRGQSGQTNQVNQADQIDQTDSTASTASTTSRTDQNQANVRDQNRTGTNATAMSGMHNQSRQLTLASDIKGQTLRNGGQDVGDIEDIIIQVDQRKATALVDPSSDMGDADGKFLVPFSRIDRGGDERYTTTLTRQDFERARGGTATPATGADRNLDRIERWSDDNRVIGMTKSD